MKHTPYCDERTEKYRKELAEFEAKYPNYCRKCGGEGVAHYSENQSPLGSGQVWLQDTTEPCPECVEKGVCALCGGEFAEDDEECEKCPHCEWHWELGLIAPYYECECWQAEIDEAEIYLEDWKEEASDVYSHSW